MARVKAFFDKYTEKFISRKFLVFILATIGVAAGFITEDNWTAIAIAYVGMEGFSDLAVRWKSVIGSVVPSKRDSKLNDSKESNKSSSDESEG